MNNKQPAYSLIFALVMMTGIMVISSMSIEDTRSKMESFRAIEGMAQARLYAESAAEMGVVDFKSGNFSTSETNACMQGTNGSVSGSNGQTCENSYTIQPYAEENSSGTANGEYFIPTPGDGDAVASSLCYEGMDVDHGCNWNKLVPGERETIPLYYSDGITNRIPTFTSWGLKMRTPCSDGTTDDDCGRYTFYHFTTDQNGNGRVDDDNRVLVYWELSGYDSSGNQTLSVLPNDYVTSAGTGVGGPMGIGTGSISTESRNNSLNTEIHEVLINDKTTDGSYLLDNIQNNVQIDALVNSTTEAEETLFLTLEVINSLYDENDSQIPHLEYQLFFETTDVPVLNHETEVTGQGYYTVGDSSYFFPYEISYSSSTEPTSLFTLSN